MSQQEELRSGEVIEEEFSDDDDCCPNCGCLLVRQEGCLFCPNCGWGRCG